MLKDKIKILLHNDKEIECDKLLAFTTNDELESLDEQVITGDWDVDELENIIMHLEKLMKDKLFVQLTEDEKRLLEEIAEKKEIIESKLYSSLSQAEKKLYDKLYNHRNLKGEVDMVNQFDKEIERFFDEILNDINSNKENNNDSNFNNDDKVVYLSDFRK